MDTKFLANYFCKLHGVSDVPQIVPFRGAVAAWQIPRETKLATNMVRKNVEVNLGSPQKLPLTFTPDAWLNDPQPKEKFAPNVDTILDMVCIYDISAKHYEITHPIPWQLKLNYYHEGHAKFEDTKQQDKIFAAASAIGEAAIFNMMPGKSDINVPALISQDSGYLNAGYVRTFALINETNLKNGVIHIPQDVCIKAKLPVFTGDFYPHEALVEESITTNLCKKGSKEYAMKRDKFRDWFKAQREQEYANVPRIKSFYAIPASHVLAWGYASQKYLAHTGQRAEQFGYYNEGKQFVVVYYLVADLFYESNLRALKETLMGKVDVRPLTSAGFDLIPITNSPFVEIPPEAKVATGDISLQAFVSFFSMPAMPADYVSALAPELSPDFTHPHFFTK